MKIQRPEYTIEIDFARRLIEVSIFGYLDGETVMQHFADARSAHDQLVSRGCPRGQHLLLVDLREGAVQSQESMRELSSALEDHSLMGRRTAVVVKSMLVKMQLRRQELPNHKIFDDRYEAVRWLIANE